MGIVLTFKLDPAQQIFTERVPMVGGTLQKAAGFIQVPAWYQPGIDDPGRPPLRPRVVLLRGLLVPAEGLPRLGRPGTAGGPAAAMQPRTKQIAKTASARTRIGPPRERTEQSR